MNRSPRVFALSDTHLGGWPSIPVDADLIIHAGDFYDGPQMDVIEDDADSASANAILYPDAVRFSGQTSAPIYAVRGNHDYADPFGFFHGRDVTGTATVWENRLIVAGVGLAYPRYFDLPTESDLQDVCERTASTAERLRRRLGPLPIVLVSHYPGGRMFDSQNEPGWTFGCVDALVDRLNPELVVVGHLHSRFGQSSPRCLIPGPAGTCVNMTDRLCHPPLA